MNKKVIVIVPIYRTLTSYERISKKSLLSILGEYEIVAIGCDLKVIEEAGFQHYELFNETYFKSIVGYNKLMLQREFYERFSLYNYILIYQLDCLVFKNELNDWLNLNISFIGAPSLGKKEGTLYFKGGCNGGFSLRCVSDFLTVFDSNIVRPIRQWVWELSVYSNIPFNSFRAQLLRSYYEFNHQLNFTFFAEKIRHNEDGFWSYHANKYYKGFKIAEAKEMTKFAFEREPEWLWKQNNQQLPFGCHAWEKYDLNFWKRVSSDLLESVLLR